MKLLIKETLPNRAKKRLLYRPEEFAFDTEPSLDDGFTSLLVNEIQLEVNDEGIVVSVWGLSPSSTWITSDVGAPVLPKPGSLKVLPAAELLPGVGVRLTTERLPAHIDPVTGWLRIGGGSAGAGRFVEVLDGAVVEIEADGSFSSLWLRVD